MCLNRLGQRVQVITALEKADDLAAAILAGAVGDESSQRNEVFGLESQRADRIGSMRIEAGADQYQLGLRPRGRGLEHVLKSFDKLAARDAKP